MKLYPAIDLKEGKCVRLYQGDMAQATIYADNPATQANAFEAMGFQALHVVDLDAAVSGESHNHEAVLGMLKACTLPIQLGGGIRSRAAVETWLEIGVTRVILGTVALTKPTLVKEVAKAFPGQIMVGIDARDGMVATEGWVKDSNVSAVELAKLFEDAGITGIIYTDIARDGTLAGPNIAQTVALAEAVSIPVILSGGIGSLTDVQQVVQQKAIAGIVIGKALYEHKLDAKEALKLSA